MAASAAGGGGINLPVLDPSNPDLQNAKSISSGQTVSFSEAEKWASFTPTADGYQTIVVTPIGGVEKSIRVDVYDSETCECVFVTDEGWESVGMAYNFKKEKSIFYISLVATTAIKCL